MKPKAEIRTSVHEEDIPRMREIECLCFSDPWSEESLKSEGESPFAVCSLYTVDGTVEGYITGSVLYEDGEIHNVAVDPSLRRQGAATKMMESFLEQCRSKGAEKIFLEVRAGNVPAIGLYRKFGFEDIGIRKGYYENPAEDALIMGMKLC